MVQHKQPEPLSFFENKNWVVNETGIVSKTNKEIVVGWENVDEVFNGSVRTVHPFYKQPYPFWGHTLEQKWFDYETYQQAMMFALGHVALTRWNLKAVRQYNANNPNS